MVSKDAKIQRLERELHRVRTSPSFRLGTIITNAIKKPWLSPFLLFSMLWQIPMMGLELLGKKAPPSGLARITLDPNVSKRNCIVMFPTNGVGFGHFTRMLSLAKQMKKNDPEVEIIFFTTMPTLHILKEYGIPAHHISGSPYFDGMSTLEWNALLEEELSVCLESHRPKQFVFDGSFPYRGMLRAIKSHTDLDKIWVRRGMFRRGKAIPVDSISHFDLIVHPEDSVPLKSNENIHTVESINCSPITLLEPGELMGKTSARRRLKLPENATVVYVQIGAGEINDIDSEVRMTVDALTEIEGVYVVIGESMIGDRIEIDLPKVHILRDYPNSLYYNAFDYTVQAGGYNSFHEVSRFGLPTLFYPNMFTGMDDQLARCMVAEKEGWGIVLEKRDQKTISKAITNLLLKSRKRLSLTTVSGSIALAEELIQR